MRKTLGKINDEKLAKRIRKKLKIRKTVIGTSERPRICPNKTNRHFFVQAIDDSLGRTLFSVQTFGKNAVAGAKNDKNGATLVGTRVAEGLKERKISQVVFDRNGYKYSGVIQALADSIRKNGIQL